MYARFSVPVASTSRLIFSIPFSRASAENTLPCHVICASIGPRADANSMRISSPAIAMIVPALFAHLLSPGLFDAGIPRLFGTGQ